jgi:hypothetical protein
MHTRPGTTTLIGEPENEVADMNTHTGTAGQEPSSTPARRPSLVALGHLLVMPLAAQHVASAKHKRPIESYLVDGALIVAELLHQARDRLSQVTERLASRRAPRGPGPTGGQP